MPSSSGNGHIMDILPHWCQKERAFLALSWSPAAETFEEEIASVFIYILKVRYIYPCTFSRKEMQAKHG